MEANVYRRLRRSEIMVLCLCRYIGWYYAFSLRNSVLFEVFFGGSSGARVAVLSLVIWEMFGAEKVSHYYGLMSGLVGSEKV